MKWNPSEMSKKAEEDFETTWMGTINLVAKSGGFKPRKSRGEALQVFDLVQKARDSLMAAGFSETSLPLFVKEDDVRAQHGPDSNLILNSSYYVAGTNRPTLTVTNEIFSKITKTASTFTEEKRAKLQKILNKYTSNEIAAEDIQDEMVKLGLRMEQVTQILGFFPELSQQETTVENIILSSHLTTSWFETINVISTREPLPLQLFNINVRFRRGKKVDEQHLTGHIGGSAIILDENVSLEDGSKIVEKVLNSLGVKKMVFEKKPSTTKYYIPGTEYEVFTDLNGKRIEIADFGLYSPIVLSHYGIDKPVFGFGFGVERIVMAVNSINDIRQVSLPQFYGGWELEDKEIAELIRIKERPITRLGRSISMKIAKACERYGGKKSPCEFKVFEGEVEDKLLEVWVIEKGDNTTLCGPAHLNELTIFEGNILAIPPSGYEDKPLVKQARLKGRKPGIGFVKAFADFAAVRIERMPLQEQTIQISNIRKPSDINIELPAIVENYAESKEKLINVRGPMFTTVKTRVKQLWKQPKTEM